MSWVTYDVSFKGETASNNGLLVVRRPDIPIPERKVELTTVAGRDGALVGSVSRYECITISVNFNFMINADDWNERLRMAKKWAQGSGELIMSDDQNYYFKVLYTRVTLCERTSKKIGVMSVDFICDPYQYRVDGDREYTAEQCAFNPYDVCHPAYIISGTGTAALTINGNTVQALVSDTLTIDTDLMLAYDGGGNVANTSTIGDYEKLYLQEGENTITINSGFALSIIPRWRHI